MIKYILMGVVIFVCNQINSFLGLISLFLTLAYIIYVNVPTFYSIKGNRAMNDGDIEKALEAYEKAYKTKRASASVCMSYGVLLLRCGRPDESLTVFNNLILNPATKPKLKNEAKQYRTLNFYKLGQVEDALEEAQEIFDGYKNTVSYGLLCYLKLATNQPIDEVFPLCVEAYEYNSDDRDIVDNLALAYIKKGDFEKAKELCDLMLEKFPAFTEAYYHGAVCYSKLGNTKKAKELLELIDTNCKRTYLTTVSVEEVQQLKNSLC